MTFTRAISTNNYGVAKFIVATSAANGTHTTLASAMSAASVGDTIFLRDSVTENVTITPGVNIAGLIGDSLNLPTITGTLTMTAAGTSSLENLRLATNSAVVIAITGSAASILNVNHCYLNCSNNTGITFSSSSASARLNLFNCKGDLSTTGIGIFAHSSAGILTLSQCLITNSGGSTTSSTVSAGNLQVLYTQLFSPVTSSGTGAAGFANCNLNTTTENATTLTLGGSGGAAVTLNNISSGTASAISIGATASVNHNHIISTNANAITGAGTISYSGNTFSSSTTAINTTTQTIAGALLGSRTTAPTVGMLGEQLTANASSVATTSGAAKTITSVSLTAGVWDVSGCAGAIATGGTALAQAITVSISATDNTLGGTFGLDRTQYTDPTGFSNASFTVGPVRLVLTATTTYYLVVQNAYTSTTCPTNAKITATRVG